MSNSPTSLRQLHEQRRYTELLAASPAVDGPPAEQAARTVLRAIAHHHLGQFAEAQALFERWQGMVDRFDADTLADWAALLILRGDLPGAQAALDTVLSSQPDHALALARRAWCKSMTDDLASAEADMARSLALQPERLAAWLLLARLRLAARQPRTADAAPAAAQGPRHAVDRARELLAAQNPQLPEDAAQQYARQVAELQLACWLDDGRLAEAEAWVAAQPDDEAVDWSCQLALGLARHDRHAEAEDSLRRALQRHADNVPLLLTAAELAEVQGRSGQAIHLVRQAIRHDPDNPQLHARLARIGARDHGGACRQAAEKAVALAEALVESDTWPAARIAAVRLDARLALAEVESQAQHYDAADALFRDVLAEQPWHIGALRALGGQELQRGRIDEAVALFERVRQIDPVSGHTALINARRFPEDEATLALLDRAARQPSLEGPARSSILFQLAAAWEKREDYAKAFAYAREANALSKRFLRYDPKAHRQACARTRHAFCRALYTHRRDSGHPSTLPIFVLGMPRSGTTLVEQIIAGHSQIFGAGELGVIPQRIAGLGRWEHHVGSGRRYPDCVDDLTPEVVNGIAEGILDELRQYAQNSKPNARHVVDKLPHNFENIGLIKFLFPNAKIISVRRDPRDVAISNYFTDYAAKHGGMGFAYDLEWIGEQLADHNLLMHHWRQTFPGEILEIDYEDVVEDTEAAARKLLDYIGVPWEAQVLDFDTLDRPVKTASVWQVRQPIYKTSTAKWRHYQAYLAPLIQGTNRKITWEAIEMLSLPEPGLLQKGVALYKADRVDEAEYEFRKLLHHLPEHAAAQHMLGIIYACKGYLHDAIALMEKARKTCPWNAAWRKDLIQALEMGGFTERAEQLKAPAAGGAPQHHASPLAVPEAP
ncbi:sulfotransferase [Pseudorhodoferax sp.]|uniref:sulfotransferase n=1 Tax=Pseudorhodoferax sp. TaxID=1993553 RepID=UPI0039E318B4